MSAASNKYLFLIAVLLFSGCTLQQRQEQLDAKLHSQSSTVDDINERLTLMQKKVDLRDEKIIDLERNIQQERADVQVVIDDLRGEIQRLRGSQEESAHAIELLKIEIAKLRSDYQNSSATSSKPLGEVEAYNQAYKTFMEDKNYAAAAEQMRAFISQYANSKLADSATYWIGEAQFRQQKYKEAITEFQNVVDKFPKSSKLCAAILGQGLSFEQLKDNANARLFYEEVMERCKGSKEAGLASEGYIRTKPATKPVTKKPSKPKRK